jgi:UDP-N-acetylmuramoyl-tripeptide--D-alanyl-D-alanine ligase
MALFTVEEILEVTGGRLLAGAADGRTGVTRVTTDSRDVRRGDLFVALRGETFDGHDFVGAALAGGAAGALVQRAVPEPAAGARRGGRAAAAPFLVLVPDSLLALQALAAHHRGRFTIPVIAVTGSNGKTTTKEMVATVLAERGPLLKTEGNLNNRIGVPLTLLRLTSRHGAAVVEMGVDRRGQTTRLCEIARPTAGLITNIGPDHLEFFGGLEGSARAKGELLDFLPPAGVVALNVDDPFFEYLASRARCRVLPFGFGPAAEVRASDLVQAPEGARFQLTLPGRARTIPVTLRLPGVHNVANALAAAAIGHALGVGGAAIARGLGRVRAAPQRTQMLMAGGVRIINDCYNANPASMKAAIDLLAELACGGRSIAVLGDMLELGPGSEAWHREVGAHLAGRDVSHVVACGLLGRKLAQGARAAGLPAERVSEVADAAGAATLVRGLVRRGDTVLVKASRGMKLERVVAALAGKAK